MKHQCETPGCNTKKPAFFNETHKVYFCNNCYKAQAEADLKDKIESLKCWNGSGKQLFGVFEDLARAYVGPFFSLTELLEHADWCKNVRGDGGELIDIVTEIPEEDSDPFIITPKEDRKDISNFA